MKTYNAPKIVEYGNVRQVVRAVAKGTDILEGNFKKTAVSIPNPVPVPDPTPAFE